MKQKVKINAKKTELVTVETETRKLQVDTNGTKVKRNQDKIFACNHQWKMRYRKINNRIVSHNIWALENVVLNIKSKPEDEGKEI